MKKIFLLPALLLLLNAKAQNLYKGKDNTIHFFSKTSMKDIEAKSVHGVTVLNASTGDFQVKVQNKSFRFESAFMEEHFNENYMESEKYAFTTFKGKINEKIDYTKNGEHKVTCTGTMDMHGTTKEITVPGTLKINNGEIIIEAKFKVKPADYKMKVPSLYVKEIAEEIDTDIKTVMEPFKK